jgi:hypothetical protein
MAQGRRRIPQSGPLCDALFVTGNRGAGRRPPGAALVGVIAVEAQKRINSHIIGKVFTHVDFSDGGRGRYC